VVARESEDPSRVVMALSPRKSLLRDPCTVPTRVITTLKSPRPGGHEVRRLASKRLQKRRLASCVGRYHGDDEPLTQQSR